MGREKLKIHQVYELCGLKPNTSINRVQVVDKKLKGKIKAIKIKNFTTFASQSYYPGAYLNVLVGPNGTGKSTMVTALVLGMGGAPTILGRGNVIQDFVQNGKNRAVIKIYLNRTADVDVEFTRSFTIDGKNTFLIDGNPCSERDYCAEIMRYDIQINNLCTFLPQDRVQDFAKMNNLELFKNTLKVICESELYEAYENLVLLRKQQNGVMKENDKMVTKLREISLKLESMKTHIDVMVERQRLVKQLGIAKFKLLWKKLENAIADVKKLEKHVEKAKSQVIAQERLLVPLTREKSELQKRSNQMKNTMAADQAIKDKAEKQLKALGKEMESLERDMNRAKTELNAIKAEMMQHAVALASSNFEKQQLIMLLDEAVKHGRRDQLEKRIKTYEEQSAKLLNQVNELVICKHRLLRQTTAEYQENINRNDDQMNLYINRDGKKLQFLRSVNSDAYQAISWVKSHASRLKGKVYKPLMLEMNISDECYLKYFENVISTRDTFALICERTEDMEVLMEQLSRQNSLKLNFIHSEAATVNSRTPSRTPIEKLAPYGFYTYMSSLITGPAPIINYLFRTYRLEFVPIGNDITYALDESAQIPRNITTYFSTNHRFEIHKSQYSSTLSTSSREIKRRHILPNVFQENTEAIEIVNSERATIEETQNTRLSELKEIVKMIERYYGKNNEILNDKNKLETYVESIKVAKMNLDEHVKKMARLIENPINLPLKQKQFVQKITDLHKQLMTVHKKKFDEFKVLTQLSVRNECECSKLRIIDRKLLINTNQMEIIKADVDRAKTKLQELSDMLKSDERGVVEIERQALSLSGSFKPDDQNYPDKNEYNALPNTVDSLKDRCHEISGLLSCMIDIDQNLIDEYEQHLEMEKELKGKIIANTKANSNVDESIQKIHVLWCQDVRKNIAIINKNYARFMAAMGYVGEVNLIRKNERDYQDYGIQLMVKFRDKAPLKPLDRYVQSGGERAVATAIYTLATQQVASVPFRCVDEINQGMDPRNETKIFNMLVEETAKPSESQYFFVTPKPIDDLSSNDDVAISIVYNSSMLYNTNCFPEF